MVNIGDLKCTIGEGFVDVQTTAGVKILEESSENGLHNAGTLPKVIATKTGLPGGKIVGKVVPGGIGAELPQDAVEDGTLVDGRTTAQCGRWWRGNERLNKKPLFISYFHGNRGIFE